MQAPWYYGSTAPTLRHQRQQEDKVKKFDHIGNWYKKGLKGVSFVKMKVNPELNIDVITQENSNERVTAHKM